MKDFCIVYSKENKPLSKKLVSKLESDGISCNVAARDFKIEDKESVKGAVENSNILLMIMDKKSATSTELINSLELALENELDIVPFVAEKIDSDLYSEHFFYQYSWIDAYDDSFEDAYDVLLDAYEELSGKNPEKNKGRVSKKGKKDTTTNKTIFYVLAAIIAIVVGYVVYDNMSVSSDNDDLISGEWRLLDYHDNIRRTGQDSLVFVTQTLPSIKKSALVIFNDDHTFERQGFSPEPQIGTWEINQEGNKIRLTPHGAKEPAPELTLEGLSKTRFTIIVTEIMQDSSKVNTRLTFGR